ncbi:MAG: GNAT family N-acetyltransferase [Dehalococcoidales bacterium]
MDTLKIKTVTSEDIDDVLKVYRQCEDFLALGPRPEASAEMVLSDMEEARREGGIFRGIYTGDKMIGVVSYVRKGFKGKLSNAFLSLLMIIPSFRGKETGTKIVKMVEKEILADAHVMAILSAVQVNNPNARRFWEKNGYRIVSGPEAKPDKTTVFQLRKDVNR